MVSGIGYQNATFAENRNNSNIDIWGWNLKVHENIRYENEVER